MLCINLSGRRVEGYELAPLVGVKLPGDGNELVLLLRDTLTRLDCADALTRGETSRVILPGLPQASAIIVVEWLKMFPRLPEIVWAVQGAEGFEYLESTRVDLEDLAQGRS